MSDNSSLILAAFILTTLIAVGLVVFIVTAIGRRQSKKEPIRPVQAVAPVSAPTAPPTSLADSTSSVELTLTPAHPGEVMRVIREPQTGRILVEVNGQRYGHIREIQDAQVGRRVLWAIADLLRFTGGMAANPQALKNIAPPEEATAPAAPAQPVETATARPAQVQSHPQPEGAPTAPPLAPSLTPPPTSMSQPASPSLANVGQTITTFFRRGLEPAPTFRPMSFIDQIEAILQRRIEALPQPLPVEVHVQSAPDGSLQIEVGYRIYHSPAEVPDPQIRRLIQDAVAEWEKR